MPHLRLHPAALLASVFCFLLVAPTLTHAQALLQVTAAGDSSTDGGPSATSLVASTAGFTSSTTRILSESTGSVTGASTTTGNATAKSLYTISGIADGAPVTLTWAFTGSRLVTGSGASVQNGLGFRLADGGGVFFYEFSWGVNFTDGPGFGGFSGTNTAGASVTATGATENFVLNFPATWSGLGTINPQLTLPLNNAMTGSYRQSADISLAGSGDATYSIELLSATVPDGIYLTGPAFITLDSGLQIPITTAVPEPSTYALMFGTAALGWVAWRRRR